MSDRYAQLTRLPMAGTLTKRIGLPQPLELERGPEDIQGRVRLGGDGRLAKPAANVHAGLGVEIVAGVALGDNAATRDDAARVKALVYDASGIARSADLVELQRFFHPTVRGVLPSGRIVVLAGPADSAAQRALEGFTRSLAKEVGRGIAVQLVRVAPGAEDQLGSTLRFLLSPRSAYVSGQVISISPADRALPDSLEGKVALVTGAARGIGASIAEVLARDGAEVVCLDVGAMGEELSRTANRIGGSALQLDITAPDAPATLATHMRERHGGAGIVVHNAGITRDKTLARMTGDAWDAVLGVNLSAQERLTDALLADGGLTPDGRIVSVSSMNGIAGQRGQTNYATSKAGIIGMVQALAPVLGERGGTINAVAPGFIETQMTASMPLGTREAGRRMNSLAQGGLPVDVAETVAWFASPGSAGVNGNVVRVCGQSLIGA
jgi:3-oxoacyl-[acyl-carrier protein] reductase